MTTDGRRHLKIEDYGIYLGNTGGNLECGSAQPSLFCILLCPNVLVLPINQRVGSHDVPVGDIKDKDMAQAVEDDGNIHQRTEVPSDGSISIKMDQKPINTARNSRK